MTERAGHGEREVLAEALGRIRRQRGLSRRELARALRMPLRTYDACEAGDAPLPYDRLAAFAQVTDCDLPALLLCGHFGSPDLALLAADNKAVSIALAALEEVQTELGEGLARLTSARLIAAFDLARAEATKVSRPRRQGAPELGVRQVECLRWVQAGKSSYAIGQILGISSRTVDDHITIACARLDVRTRVQAVSAAIRLGYLSP